MPRDSKKFLPSRKIVVFLILVILFFSVFFGYKPLLAMIRSSDLRGNLTYSPTSNSKTFKTGADIVSALNALQAESTSTLTVGDYFSGKAASSSPVNDPNNLTAQAAAGLFAQYSIFQDQNGDVSADNQTQIVNNTVASLQTDTIKPKYTLNDIKTFDSSSLPKVKDFSNQLITLQEKFDAQLTDNLSTDQTISIYKNLVNELADLQGPSSIKENYLNLVNNYYIMSELLKMYTSSVDDPLKAYLAVNSYSQLITKNQDIYKQFADYFKKSGIIWSDNEPGSLWNEI